MIIYYSCTGNTRWAAETLSALLGEELISAVDAIRGGRFSFTLAPGEKLGLMFPVHGWRPPLPFREFLRKLIIEGYNDNYTFAVCTAGDNIGETMDLLCADAAEAGIHVDAMQSLLMPESYVGMPFMDVDKPYNERRKIEESAKRLRKFAEQVEKHTTGYRDLDLGRWPKINSRLIGGYFTGHLLTDKHFRVSEEKCIGCGRCEKVCPTGNISLSEENAPVWHHDNNCISCFACYHHCPVRAIEYGSKTRGKGQYYFGRYNMI